ncbi:MAG: hypothetical protein AB7F86_09695 [Bdellovibrionales bacterium]
MNTINIETIASHLGGKRSGSGFIAKCPAHDDHSPSLSLSDSHDGRILVKCHAGCSQEAVVDALKSRGLWPSSRAQAKRTEWIYYDGAGKPALKVTRTDMPDGAKRFFQSHMASGTWRPGGAKSEVFPYLLEEWRDAKDRWLFLVEGEKCADALAERGFLATTTPGGSKSWGAHFAKHFEGRKVALLPDNDEPGRAYIRQVFNDIKSLTAEVRVIELPDLPLKGDVADFFESGGTAATLKELITSNTQAPPWLEQSEPLAEVIEIRHESFKRVWPEPLESEAFHGIAGKFVKAIEPCTESDSAALLIQFLAAFGNAIGRKAYIEIEADKHYCNLFCVIVGESAKGRKGTSLGHIKRLFSQVDADWWDNCKASGLTSGEGIASAVRDPLPFDPTDPDAKPEKPRDKRLLAVETEFAAVLRASQREGNTLSSAMRDSWDHGDLRTLTKKDPVKATGAHVSFIGHITKVELNRYLSHTDIFNGFGNRFIWMASKRSKLLPLGGKPNAETMLSLRSELAGAIERAKLRGIVALAPETERLYAELYMELAKEKPGLVGVLTSRAEPIILRLALIYALLDSAQEVQADHLRSAVAVWQYAEQSVEYIFGGSTGDKTADRILAALESTPEGLTTSQIHADVLGGHGRANQVSEALKLLEGYGLAHSVKEQGGGPKPKSRWFLGSANCEFSEFIELPSKNSHNSQFARAQNGGKT